MDLYVVIADDRFEGLFRSRVSAERLKKGLCEFPINWRQGPEIFSPDEVRQRFNVHAYTCTGDMERAIENGWFGRRN